jgi:hypothetical protein
MINAVILLWCVSPSLGFVNLVTPAQYSRSASLPALKVDDDAGLKGASDFMIDHFWLPLTPTSLTDPQRTSLLVTQLADFEGRYGRLLGKRKLNSALLVQRDGDGSIEVQKSLIRRMILLRTHPLSAANI